MNSKEEDHTSSLINSLEELYGDDDKFFTVNHGDQSIFHSNLYGNNQTTSTSSSHFGFSLNLSVLQNPGSNSPRRSADSEEQLRHSPPQSHASGISPRFHTGDSNHPSPRREIEIYPLGNPLNRVDNLFGQTTETRPRHESDGYYSPRNVTPRELTSGKESGNYYLEQSNSSRRDEPYYSPREIRSSDGNGYAGGVPIQSRRDNDNYFPSHNPSRGRQEGYYSPREVPQPSLISKLSPRDPHYPERPMSRESDSYYGSREPTPRDHSYRRDSSDSTFYHSPRDSAVPSPRAPNDSYYGGSRELTPREQIRKNSAEYYASSKADIPTDKSLPNPYAAPFVPQRNLSNPSYAAPVLTVPPQYYTQPPRQQAQPNIPYDYLQRPSSFPLPGPESGNRQGQFHPAYLNQYNESLPPTLQHSAPYLPDQHTQPSVVVGSSQRPNVPPLSFSGLSSGEYTSTDSEESNSTSGYFSPKYGNAVYSRTFSGQQLRPGIPSPASTRPYPLLKSNSEKMFDPRRVQSFSVRTSFSNKPSHTSSTGNLSGRGKFSPDEEKALYYQITPQQQQLNAPPPPMIPLKILSIDVNGSFNATDDAHTLPRNAFFDFIQETKAQVILMYNTGLENEDQLKIVRNEVKAKYNTESAMWASFKGPGPDGGRGVGVLVLGPLAPRTGWIVSDSCGHILSASSRVKPGLPVLCFVACDCFVPPLDPTPFESLQANLPIPRPPGDVERKEKVMEKLKEIMTSEQDKGVFVFAAGDIFIKSLFENDTASASSTSPSSSDEQLFKDNGMIRMTVTRTPYEDFTSSSPSSDATQQPHGQHELSDVLVTHQPFGDGPRPPDGTGMKVLSTETLPTSQVTSPHEPTLIQIAVYGWPSETFVFSQKSDTPLSSGRKSRRSKSGKKKDELSPQLQHQLSLGASPRGMGMGVSPRADSSSSPYPFPVMQPPPPPSTLLDSPMTTLQYQRGQQQLLQQQHLNANLSSPRMDLHSWKMKVIEFHSRLHDILQSTSWGVVRLDQMKFLLHEMFRWIETFTAARLVDVSGFPTSKSISALQEISTLNADQFLKSAPERIGQLLQSWLGSPEADIPMTTTPSYSGSLSARSSGGGDKE